MAEDRPSGGCDRIDYHLIPINRTDHRKRKGTPVATTRDWLMRAIITLVIALVGGIGGSLFGNYVEGAVRESRLIRIEAQVATAESERKITHRDMANLREQWANDFGELKAIVSGGIGDLKGQIRGLRHTTRDNE